MDLLVMANDASKGNLADFEVVFKYIKRHKWRNEPRLPEGDRLTKMRRMMGEDADEGLKIMIVARNDKYDMDDAVSLMHFIDDFPGWHNEPRHILAVEMPAGV